MVTKKNAEPKDGQEEYFDEEGELVVRDLPADFNNLNDAAAVLGAVGNEAQDIALVYAHTIKLIFKACESGSTVELCSYLADIQQQTIPELAKITLSLFEGFIKPYTIQEPGDINAREELLWAFKVVKDPRYHNNIISDTSRRTQIMKSTVRPSSFTTSRVY
jgi:hypothetical protein